jgi:hypothetical protein
VRDAGRIPYLRGVQTSRTPDLRSGALTAWGNAWLDGLVGLDDVLTEIRDELGGHGAPHSIGGEPLAIGLGALRRAGVWRLRLVLPVPGDVSGLPGAPSVTADALAAGEAVVCLGPDLPLVLVPSVTAHGPVAEGGLESVHWQVASGTRTPPPPAGVRAADGELAEAIGRTTAELVRLDVGRARPEILAALRGHRDGAPGRPLPPGYPPAAHALLARAGRLARILDLAAHDDGGAVTAGEVSGRSAALRALSAAVRHARESAYDAFVPTGAAVPPPP